MAREPVPLRCFSCDEIIYSDQPHSEYDSAWGEEGDHWWHDACIAAHEEKDMADKARHREYIKGLKARPFESLGYEDALTLSMSESADRIIDFITQTDYFGTGSGVLKNREGK